MSGKRSRPSKENNAPLKKRCFQDAPSSMSGFTAVNHDPNFNPDLCFVYEDHDLLATRTSEHTKDISENCGRDLTSARSRSDYQPLSQLTDSRINAKERESWRSGTPINAKKGALPQDGLGLHCQELLELASTPVDFSDSPTPERITSGIPIDSKENVRGLHKHEEATPANNGSITGYRVDISNDNASKDLARHFAPWDTPFSSHVPQQGTSSESRQERYGPWDSSPQNWLLRESSEALLYPDLDYTYLETEGEIDLLSTATPPKFSTHEDSLTKFRTKHDEGLFAYDPDRGLILTSNETRLEGDPPSGENYLSSILGDQKDQSKAEKNDGIPEELRDEDILDALKGGTTVSSVEKPTQSFLRQEGLSRNDKHTRSRPSSPVSNRQSGEHTGYEAYLSGERTQLEESPGSSRVIQSSPRLETSEILAKRSEGQPQKEKRMKDAFPQSSDMVKVPITRPPFPQVVQDRSLVDGLVNTTSLRTCFRLGEALNVCCQAVRSGKDVVLELYARVLSSERDIIKGIQTFHFADLFHSDHPPFLLGRYEGWKGIELWDYDCHVFLGDQGSGRICRCIGRMRRESKQWVLDVMSIWQAGWDDVTHVEGIIAGHTTTSECN